MSKKNKDFPAFLHPRSCTRWKGHSVVDYGVNDAIDIKTWNDNLQIDSRKSFIGSKGYQAYYETASPCLPLSKPNDVGRFPVVEEVKDVWISPHEYKSDFIGKMIKTPNEQHWNKLFIDYPELLIGNITSEIDDCEKDLLSRHFHPLKYGYDVPCHYSKFKRQPMNYRKFFKYSDISQRRIMGRFNMKKPSDWKPYVKQLDDLLGTISEIPRDLLLDYLDEELMQKYDMLTTNYHLGNCLAHSDDLLIYPKGSLDTLGISPLDIQKNGCQSHLKEEIWLQTESKKEQNFELDGTIHEVQCVDHGFGEFSLGVRNDFSCTFFSKCSQDSSTACAPRYFQQVDKVTSRSKILAMAVNPYFGGDMIMAKENGTFTHWADGNTTPLAHAVINDSCSCNELFWINCSFSSNPRCFIVNHQEDVYKYDMRSPQKPCQLMLQLPNTYLNRMDKLTRPISLHPSNSHQILLTSQQSLIVMDERFANSPLIAVNHYMRAGPQFMHTTTSSIDSSVHTLAVLGGYRYRETRCIEFEQESSKEAIPEAFRSANCDTAFMKSLCCTRKPWELSQPESWLKNFTHDARSLSSGVKQRLMQPLIGVSVLTIEAESSTNHVAVQQTKSGDLFYQLLRNKNNLGRDIMAGYANHGPRTVNNDKFANSSRTEFETLYDRAIGHAELKDNSCKNIDTTCVTTEVQKQCKNWIYMAYEAYQMNPSTNESAKICSMAVKTDDGKISKAYDQQKRHFEMFSDVSSEMPHAANDTKLDVSVDKESLNAVQETASFSAEVQAENDAFVGVTVVEPIEKQPFKGVSINPFEISNTQENTQTSACPICQFPIAIDDTTCSCCHLEVDVANKLRTAQESCSVLTNNFLEREFEVPSFELVKYPEKSRDPLSIVLFTNLNNDGDYTPIDLAGKFVSQEETAQGSAGKSRRGRKRGIKREKVTDELDESDGWFLNESGSLEVRQKDRFEKFKEDTFEIGSANKERLTRSKTRELRTKVLNSGDDGGQKGINRSQNSKGILKTKDGQTEMKHVEKLNPNNTNRKRSVDSNSTGQERITSPEVCFDTQYRNVSNSSERANRVVTIRRLFGSRETDLVSPIFKAESQHSSLIKDTSQGRQEAILKTPDAGRDGPRYSRILGNAKVSPHEEHPDFINSQTSESISWPRDGEERFDRDPGRTSEHRISNVVSKEVKTDNQRSTPVKRYSPLKSSNTPRKKKVGRVMGF